MEECVRFTDGVETARIRLGPDTPFIGKTLNELNFRGKHGVNVLAIRREERLWRADIQDIALAAEDDLLVFGRRKNLEALSEEAGVAVFQGVSRTELLETFDQQERLRIMQVPEQSTLVGKTLKETRLGGALGGLILGILRQDRPVILPEPWEKLKAGDRLVVGGSPSDLEVLHGLEGLAIDVETHPDLEAFIQRQYGLVEAILAPRSPLIGKSLRQINFREKFGLNVLAIWREGTALYADLRDTALKFGDALLLFGPGGKLRLLGQEPDFIVLTETAQERPRLEKAKLSVVIMAAVILPVVFGWIPIYIAAMATAMAASASFTTPIAHPANILVMGPGGYRFADYLKVGGLLTMVIFLVIVFVLPFFWPMIQAPRM